MLVAGTKVWGRSRGTTKYNYGIDGIGRVFCWKQ